MSRPILSPAAAMAVAAAILPLSLHAAERIAPVTVTATRTAETADETLSSVSVITREEIERSQTTSLTELLGRQPGVEFARNGGRGTNSSIYLRGTESDHVLVLVDGVEVGSATTGTTAFEGLPLANVERIEIVRGPRSSLYGSRAIGGVIQIFTRDGEGGHASIGAGSNDLRKGSAGYGFKSGGTSVSLNFSAEETDGIDARENDCAFCADEPDDDGYESRSVNLNASQDIGERVTVSGRILAADSETEFDGTENSTENEQRIYSARVDAQVTSSWNARVQVSRSEDNSQNFSDGQPSSTFNTTRNAFSLQNEITVGTSQVVSLGLDAETTNIHSTSAFAVDSRDTTGVYAQHQWMGEAWNTEISVRHESYDEFDDPVTGSVAAGYRVTPSVQAFASYGTAFRAPTFNELYFPIASYGNPDLKPEESRTAELGLRGSPGALRWETTLYSTEIDQFIVNSPDASGRVPSNIEEARITGVEVIVGVSTEQWNGDVSLDLKDTENVDTGAELPRRAQFGLKGSLTRRFGGLSVGADVQVQGQRFDRASNTTQLDAYGLIDLRASWRFARDWTTRFKVANVTDTEYTLADTYNTLGRRWILEVAWHPGASD